MLTKRILIIDDEAAIQTVAQFGINLSAGWEVLTAGSGAEGIQTAQVEKPDAILLDVGMPDLDGIATFKQLQGCVETKHIPVIFLTAKVQAEEQFRDLGIRGVIAKPFNALDLPEQISQILQW